ncbi:aldehyde dehydrogenase family protein [Enemella sp. A6]|uniref:aldehyde dehydrogenase family protein n=1 Tax=Enemella sp. A6 TaxID=3440152 RepID=UPI003EBCD699
MSELISINPATLEEVGRTPVSSPEDVDRVVREAAEAGKQWRNTSQRRRQGLLGACSVKLMQRQKEIAKVLSAEVGKTVEDAGWEIWVASYAFAHAARVEFESTAEAPDHAGRTITVERYPYGVVAAIVPWNFPAFLAAAKVASALAAGNTVVMKPAESVALSMQKVIDVLNEVLPPGVVGIVQGGPEVGKALIDHREVRKVSFTGSTKVGRVIMQQAAETLTPVTLELGGNDPAIVLDDADLVYTASALAHSAFYNAGQMCIAPKRAYVPADKVVEFNEHFAKAMSQLTVGDGSQPGVKVGPLHNKAQLDINKQLLDDAVSRGATVVAGGGRGTDLPGHFLEPTLVTGVDDSFDLVSQEQFGTVFPVVGYTDVDRVVEVVNSQEYGLGASVWGSEERATEIAHRIEAGTVWVNQHNSLEVDLPFGGVKQSGFGREGGTAGIDDFSQWRVIDVRRGG